jgi:hypothetical protein
MTSTNVTIQCNKQSYEFYLQLLFISSSYIHFQALVLPFLPPIGFAMMVAKYLPIFFIPLLQALPSYQHKKQLQKRKWVLGRYLQPLLTTISPF